MGEQNNDAVEQWRKNKAIGNICENIVEMLIQSMPGYECIKFGMENHIGELRKTLKSNLSSQSRRVRTMPDFIVVNKETKEVIFVDVKYRSFIDRRKNGVALYGFGYGQMKDYLEFWKDVKLIVVHSGPPYFYVIDMKDVEWHKHFHSRTNDNGVFHEQWNFLHIEKSIVSLFPDLSKSVVENAIKMIPGV